jgi:hypothetical protein
MSFGEVKDPIIGLMHVHMIMNSGPGRPTVELL